MNLDYVSIDVYQPTKVILIDTQVFISLSSESIFKLDPETLWPNPNGLW